MWESIVYTKAQAKNKFEQLEVDGNNCVPLNVKGPFNEFRKSIINEKHSFLSDEKNKIKSYSFDLHIGLYMYQILEEEYDFNERFAAQDEIWRYISLEVLPDLVYERYGIEEKRFYKEKRRIWLRSLWWYIHLSWQGTEEATYEVLKESSTDEINQLVDRSGSDGYRLDLTREIMRQHKIYSKDLGSRNLRRILVLNTVRINMIEPGLVEGGTNKYVEELYAYFLNDIKVR